MKDTFMTTMNTVKETVAPTKKTNSVEDAISACKEPETTIIDRSNEVEVINLEEKPKLISIGLEGENPYPQISEIKKPLEFGVSPEKISPSSSN
jgi:hypothetical protein